MFIELGAVGAVTYGYKMFKNRDKLIVERYIKDILKDNNLDYYTILDVKRNPWGYTILISLNGKGYDKLEDIKSSIETKFGYLTFIEQNKNLKTATIKVVFLLQDENTKYKPYKTKPYEIYIGFNYTLNELIVDLQKFPHLLVSGQTGSGKTEIMRLILTNLFNNFTDRDINIYFSDISDMCDFTIFEKCKQTKGYAKNIEDSEKLFSYLIYIYSKRLEIFAKNGCKNIQEYNEKFYAKRMPYNYLVLDEFGDFFPINRLEDKYELKIKCYNLLKHMVRKFRKVGIFLIIGIQRPDTTVLDSNLRSCLCTKIGFSQNSDASSLTVCDTTELANIENRKALLMYGNNREWLKTLYIDDKVIHEYIKLSLVNGSREKFNDYNKFLPKKELLEEEMNIQKAANETNKKKNSPKPSTKTKVKVKNNVK